MPAPELRIAPDEVFQASPALAVMTDEILHRHVWQRRGLCARDRSLVTLAALIATGRTALLCAQVRDALDDGLKPSEIAELLVQLAFYTGWPNAVLAAAEVRQAFAGRGIDLSAAPLAQAVALDPDSERQRRATVDAAVAPIAPGLADDTNEILFGRIWQRGDLRPRDRSLATMAALVAIGQPEQLGFHANRAMDNGLSAAEAGEALAHLAYYAGWPRAMSAVASLRIVLDQRAEAQAG